MLGVGHHSVKGSCIASIAMVLADAVCAVGGADLQVRASAADALRATESASRVGPSPGRIHAGGALRGRAPPLSCSAFRRAPLHAGGAELVRLSEYITGGRVIQPFFVSFLELTKN